MIMKILVLIVALLSVAAVVAMFSKKKYTLTRSIVINKSRKEVFDYIRMNANQKSYSKWLSLDPDTRISFRGSTDGMPGAIRFAMGSSDKVI